MQIVAVVGGKGSYWVQWCFQNLVKTQRGFYGVHGIRDNLGSDFNDSRLILSAVKGDVIVVWKRKRCAFSGLTSSLQVSLWEEEFAKPKCQ
jgi:hypothetical protein